MNRSFRCKYWLILITDICGNAPNTTMTHSELITHFYTSFSAGNAEAMAACYYDDIVFSDPAFGTLKGEDARNMWRMLMERSKGELKITFSDVNANEKTGSANWRADYTFGQTGRKIVNHITAEFEFADGKIIRHTDSFNMWKWSRQALGFKGLLLGWTPIIQKAVQKQTNKLLKSYTKKRNEK